MTGPSLDFAFSEDQEAVRALVRQILTDLVTPERLAQVEASGEWFDRDTWRALADADLLGLAVPEAYGGAGLGFLEVAIVLEEIGRAVAPVPALPTIVMGAMPIAAFGDEEQRARWLPAVVRGDVVLTAALSEPGADDPTTPSTAADVARDGWRLRGTKHCVPVASLAARMVVPARTGVGVGVFLVDPRGEGVTLETTPATHGEPWSRVSFEDAPGEALGDPAGGDVIVRWITERATVGLCALQVGVSEQALAMTAAHVTTREQFGHPIATFQAVSQRAADAYIDTEAIRLTARQAAWRLSVDLPAADEVSIAKFWAADAGQRVAHAAQHLHGGVGVDLSYPLHRYFRWSKALELSLGSATTHLRRLGVRMAK